MLAGITKEAGLYVREEGRRESSPNKDPVLKVEEFKRKQSKKRRD